MLNDIRGLIQVFELLQPEELLFSAQFVSKHWRDVARKDELWETSLSRNPWMTRNFSSEWLLNLPAIDYYIVNLRLMRNPRFLFTVFGSNNTLYSVDRDKSVTITLPFSAYKSAWVYSPSDAFLVTGGEAMNTAAHQVKLPTRIYEELPSMLRGHQWHAAILWRNGLLVAGGEDSDACEMLVNGTWRAISSLNRQRMKHSLVATGQFLYVVGGTSTVIEAFIREEWVDEPFSLPCEVNHPTIAPFQGNYLVLGGANANSLQHKPILQLSFTKKDVTYTGVVLLVVTYSNSISRQGDYLICLDFHGKIKRLSRPDPSAYPLPHSYWIDNVESVINIDRNETASASHPEEGGDQTVNISKSL